MTAKELRQTFLDFFKDKGHTIVASSSLLPTDPSVLFTTAGMQQFKPYYLGEKSPYGPKAVSCQKSFRTSDIEEVGDRRHLTFFEMLGNFSFGDYFKKESISWALEFFISKCNFPKERLFCTYFEGDDEVPEDKESKNFWLELGIPKERLYGSGRKDNFWGPTGEEGPCGPTTEIYYDLTGMPCVNGADCTPVKCECGRFIELWNLVFNEFFQDKNKKLTLLKQRGVDTGMGLERLAFVSQGKANVFESDLFAPLINLIQTQEPENILAEQQKDRAERIIADHIKAAVFLISEGVLPSNVGQGYVVRRLLRRAMRYGRKLETPKSFLVFLAEKVIEMYGDIYFSEAKIAKTGILEEIKKEEERFSRVLSDGLRRFEKIISENKEISAAEVFHLYDTYGFPFELISELADESGVVVKKEEFDQAFKEHQEISRAGAEKKFGGVGDNADSEMTKLHTATHLLHQALRTVLGDHVQQMGSDITSLRLRFDFSHPQKITEAEIKKVEEMVNQKINEDLIVKKEEMSYEEAVNQAALAFFKEKYPPRVNVFSISDSAGKLFSKEICAGPHVKRTLEIGRFKIEKEESSGAGIRRIRATIGNIDR
ncbi:MAG: alanine--tRNA ligase [bacterium]